MTSVNNRMMPTCAELAEQLKQFGDKPLFSGNGWWVVYSLTDTPEGVQVVSIKCEPRDGDHGRNTTNMRGRE